MPLPLRTVHLDEQEPGLEAFTRDRTPCVVGRSEIGWTLLLSAEDLASCQKDVGAFARHLQQTLEAAESGPPPEG